MATLEEVGERDAWRCWVCDLPVDAEVSVNDDLGPSIDRFEVFSKAPKRTKQVPEERLAHRSCNTRKGAVKPVIEWTRDVIIFDPAPILQTTERLMLKGGREVVARCASKADGNEAGRWLADRLARLVPSMTFETRVEPGAGQFLLWLHAPSRS